MLVSRWSISFKLIAAFAIVIAVFVAIAALVFFNLGNIIPAHAEADSRGIPSASEF
jgi:CHASE3 domain sensor protein